MEGNSQVIFEISITHDETANNWLEKIEDDRKKLSLLISNDIIPVQMVVFVSNFNNFMENDTWKKWYSKISFWNIPTPYSKRIFLQPEGELFIKAW
jgi:hypothetical protein